MSDTLTTVSNIGFAVLFNLSLSLSLSLTNIDQITISVMSDQDQGINDLIREIFFLVKCSIRDEQ